MGMVAAFQMPTVFCRRCIGHRAIFGVTSSMRVAIFLVAV